MKKRFLSVALAAALILLVLPAPVFAAYSTWVYTNRSGNLRINFSNSELQQGTFEELSAKDPVIRNITPLLYHPDYPNAKLNAGIIYIKGMEREAQVSFESTGFAKRFPIISCTGSSTVEYGDVELNKVWTYNGDIVDIYIVLDSTETVDGVFTVTADFIILNVGSNFQGSEVPAAANAIHLTELQTISGGYKHTLAVQNDGGLWSWGENTEGAVGDGTLTDRTVPLKIMEDTAFVSAGAYHSLAIKTDDTLWAWGWNEDRQLGDGTTTARTSPVKVMDDVAYVAGGWFHTLAVKTDGSLWSWGNNFYGQLGAGTAAAYTEPVKIMDDVKYVAAGYTHSLAIKTDGSLWAWGDNEYGQVGNGSDAQVGAPVKIMDNVASVSAFNLHSLAVKTDGTLWAWGWNENGQLGVGSVENQNKPVQVMDSVVKAAAGGFHSFAIKTDGTLWGWGHNGAYELGNNTANSTNKPIRILDAAVAVACGQQQSMAVKPDGNLYSWGLNDREQVGNNSVSVFVRTQVKVLDDILLEYTEPTEPEDPDEPGDEPGEPGDEPGDEPNPDDMPSAWAADEVNRAIRYGIVPAELQSAYTADITRAEFCALAVGIYETYTGAEITERAVLTDTTDINVQKMAGLGVVTPDANGAFNPGGTFNRQMSARLMVNLLTAMNIELPQTPTTFPDKDSIANWALEAVGQVQAAGLIGGTGDGTFNPAGKFTRQAGILLMLNLWDYLQGLPV